MCFFVLRFFILLAGKFSLLRNAVFCRLFGGRLQESHSLQLSSVIVFSFMLSENPAESGRIRRKAKTESLCILHNSLPEDEKNGRSCRYRYRRISLSGRPRFPTKSMLLPAFGRKSARDPSRPDAVVCLPRSPRKRPAAAAFPPFSAFREVSTFLSPVTGQDRTRPGKISILIPFSALPFLTFSSYRATI